MKTFGSSLFVVSTLACTFGLSAPSLPAQTNPPASPQTPPSKAAVEELNGLLTEGIRAAQKGNLTAALQAFQTGLEKAQAIKDDKQTANFLLSLGNVNRLRGRNEKALDYFQRALPLSEKMGDVPNIAKSLNGIGGVYYFMGQYEKALDYFERPLKILAKNGSEQDIASGLGNIGTVYASLGQNEKALDYFQRAIKIMAAEGDTQNLAYNLNNTSGVYLAMGQCEKALDYSARALSLQEKLENQEDIAMSLTNIGTVYGSLGQYEKALTYYQRVLSVYEKAGSNPYYHAAILLRVGVAYAYLGHYEKALDFHQRALKLNESIEQEDESALCLSAIGAVYASQGQYEKSLTFHQAALKINEKIGNEKEIARTLLDIGEIYGRLDQLDNALDRFERSLRLFEKIGNAQDTVKGLTNIGLVYALKHQDSKAEEYFSKGLRLFEKFSRDVLADPTQLGDLLATTDLYQNYALLLTNSKRPEDALLFLERYHVQALALQVGVNQEGLARLFTPEEKGKLTTLKAEAVTAARTLQRTKALSVSAVETERGAARQRLLEAEQKSQETANRFELFRDTLYNRNERFRLVQGERAPRFPELKAFSGRHPDTLYLEYAVVNETDTLVLALHNGVLSSRILACGKKRLQSLVTGWREALESRNSAEPKQAQELYAVVLQPFQSLLDNPKTGIKRLVVVADGALLDAPFAALADKSGKRLLERFAVSNALSLGILLWPPNPEIPTKELLCVADTRGEATGVQTVSRTRGGGFAALQFARAEGRAVVGFYPQGSALLLGSQATEAKVKKEMGKYAVLHFAAHGDLDTKQGLRSALVLADEPSNSDNDGFLDGREIIETGVSARLAVLSACESGQGKKSGGEGIMGLAWAFRAAGCPAVVASQWKVDDAATKDLMVAFYKGLKGTGTKAGKPKDEALRDAMLSVMRPNPKSKTQNPKSPYYWAAFQIVGDTVPLPTRLLTSTK